MPDNRQQKIEHYREKGWWPNERLELRYQSLTADRQSELAVADSRGRELTHADLWAASGQLAAELGKQSVAEGDVVLMYLPNRVEWQIALLALLRLRAVPASIPVNTDAKTLAWVNELIGSRLTLTSADNTGKNLLETVVSAAALSERACGIASLCPDGIPEFAEAPPKQREKSKLAPEVDHLMFTSSTTGLPKAVMHTADTLAALNVTFAERFSLGPDQAIFMGSPLGHSVGGIHGARLALNTGAALILQDRWDPQVALDMMNHYRCAFSAAATPFLKDLLEAPYPGPEPKMATVRSFLCGGAPVPPALLERSRETFPNTFVTNLWGMTEGGLVTCVPDTPEEKLMATAGIGLPGLELKVIDDEGRSLAVGQQGELAMRGPGVFVGYCGQGDLYRSLLTEDGFFLTGDLAVIDADGYVRITGRLKDLIIRGGVNISPLPVEDALSSHPDVRSIAVLGFPDARLGERICAVIVPGIRKPSLEDLTRFASDQGLSKRQWPELVRYVKDMPRTAAGKIRKPDLQALIRSVSPDQLDLDIDLSVTEQ